MSGEVAIREYNKDTLKKFIIKVVVIITLIVLFALGGTLAYIFSFYTNTTVTKNYDCAVVFGAAVLPGGLPSRALSDRTDAAIDLYERGKVHCLILSGAPSVYGKHEVDVMLGILAPYHIPVQDIHTDYKGFNTRATVQHLDKSKSYILVSNDFHLGRIDLLAREDGLPRYMMYKSPYLHGRYREEPFLLLRETVAFWYYALMPYSHPIRTN